MQWEAALGVSGEIMINTPECFLRRFYGGDPWDRHLSPLILDIMGAEGEGLAAGISGERLTFRTNRYSCGGDPFDEWVVERRTRRASGVRCALPNPSEALMDSMRTFQAGRRNGSEALGLPVARSKLARQFLDVDGWPSEREGDAFNTAAGEQVKRWRELMGNPAVETHTGLAHQRMRASE
jgi:hypothetical protein